MASLDNRKINLRHLHLHPRDNDYAIHFNLLVGNHKYMIIDDNLVKYDRKTYVDRTVNNWYGTSSSFHYTFKFKYEELEYVEEICKSTNMALISKNVSEEVSLFSRIKLKRFPKHVIPFDNRVKYLYNVNSIKELTMASELHNELYGKK